MKLLAIAAVLLAAGCDRTEPYTAEPYTVGDVLGGAAAYCSDVRKLPPYSEEMQFCRDGFWEGARWQKYRNRGQ